MATSQKVLLPLLQRATAGALFGAQVVVAGAVVPMSRKLPGPGYVTVHTLFTRRADAFLPLLGGTTTLTSYLLYRRDGRVADLAATSALVAAGVAASRNLAINARVASLDPDRLSESAADVRWLTAARSRWSRMHLVRLAGGALAFAAALSDGGARIGTGRPSGPGRAAPLDPLAALVAAVVVRDVVAYLRMPRQRHESVAGISGMPADSTSAETQTHQDKAGVLP